MTFLRYTPDIEQIQPDEQEAIDGIVQGMTQQTETVEQREHHAVRASHAKSTACAVGEITIPGDLPPELAQGLFARPGTYPVAVRYAQGPGETLGDRVSTHRGMAIKIFGVEGERLPGHDAPTQDFVLATGTTFPSGTAQGFLRDARQIGVATPMPEGVKSAVSSAARNFNRVLHAFGAESAKAGFFGHPFSHPLADPYFSQCPVRFGEHVAKLGAYPASSAQHDLEDWRLDPQQDEDGFRHATVDFFRDHAVVYELRAQLWTDAKTQPIEDASVDWPVDESGYRTIATIRLPAQDAYDATRQRYFDEAMTFRPAHSLAAHRPLGSVMRARLQVYQALSDFRHRENGVKPENTASIEQIPGMSRNALAALMMSRQPGAVDPARSIAARPVQRIPISLTINGQKRQLQVEPWTSLLDLLREQLALTGTKKGCDHGQCGACTVLIDGKRINSCLALAVSRDGAEVTTIEGLGETGKLHPLQAAFIEHDAFQCGYCTPGQICSAQGLINEGRARTPAEVRELMSGNLCRCGCYTNIADAVLEVLGAEEANK